MSSPPVPVRADRSPHAAARPTPVDFGASVVVFLVALPLCLGIALASGAPLVAGVVSGVVGGILVGVLSSSHVQVSGPAAGLTSIMVAAVASQGSYEAVLPAVIVAGALQLAFGALRAGFIARFVPSSVIKGMLAAIGAIIVLKQLPHLVGWDADAMGDEAFVQADRQNTFTELLVAAEHIQGGALLVGALSLVLLFGWPKAPAALRKVPAPLIAVLVGTGIAELLPFVAPALSIDPSHRVALPSGGPAALIEGLPRPDWAALGRSSTWVLAVTLAVVASLETLLSLEASLKLDPQKRDAPADRELLAQGAGNLLSGLLGGLPLTGVVVRTSANIGAGARTRWSAVLHGLWLLIAALALAALLNRIPLAALSAVLFQVGWRLAQPALFRGAWRMGTAHFIPFLATFLAILFTDLLVGIGVGLAVGVMAILRESARVPALREVGPTGSVLTRLALTEQVTFLHKAGVCERLAAVPDGGRVEVDATGCRSLDLDVLEALHNFRAGAAGRGVEVRFVGVPELPSGAGAGH
jgi:MFS superfamily sulfate permease-like transporter